MKALVLVEYKRFEYREVPDPVMGPADVLIRVKACGICGSDVHGMDGSTGRRQPPVIMGHEAAGTIEAVGQDVKDYRPGERVTFDSTIYCGECHFCRVGANNLCDNRRVIGVACDEYHQDGAMAELIAVPRRILYRLPAEISFEEAAMIEPLAVAFHAVNNTPARLNDSVVVIGAGLIGLLIIQTLRISGFGRLYCIDLDANRLALARKFGADQTFTPSETAADEIVQATGGRGVDIVYDAAGVNASFQQAFGLVRKGGNVILVGNLAKKVDLPLQFCVTREINLLTSCAINGEYESAIGILSRKLVDLKSLIGAAPKLSEGGLWFKKLHNAEDNLIKVILKP